MEVTTMTAQFAVLTKDEISGKVLGQTPTLFQVKCETPEETMKFLKIIEEELL